MRIAGQYVNPLPTVDAGAHQIATGMAWVYDRYSKPSSPLYPLQNVAREARRGLWADYEPVPPWEWRKR